MKANHYSRIGFINFLLCFSVLIGVGGGKEKVPPTKSIRGHVADAKRKSIIGAKVFIRNVNKNTTTVLVTDENGLYAVYGLDPKVDYEVHAEYDGFVSEKRAVSLFLNRFDNVFNFQLRARNPDGRTITNRAAGNDVELDSADRVKLAASWFLPAKSGSKVPAALLVHGFGQDRKIWERLIHEHLLPAGFAALSLDLRGHGQSLERAGARIEAVRAWVSDPQQFPLDIAAAVRWLKSRDNVDENRIAIVGSGLGADLAFLASGKYEEIRAAVALSGNAENATRLTAGTENFQPHSILYIATERDSGAVDSARSLERLSGFPVRIQIYEDSDAVGSQMLQQIPAVSALLMDWLKKM